jgi:hypothetical protein
MPGSNIEAYLFPHRASPREPQSAGHCTRLFAALAFEDRFESGPTTWVIPVVLGFEHHCKKCWAFHFAECLSR